MSVTQVYKKTTYADVKAGDLICLGHDERVLSVVPSPVYPARCTVVTDGGKFATDICGEVFVRLEG